jgi:hypothetical protein
MDHDPLVQDLLTEMGGCLLQADQVDQEQRRRLVREVEADSQPLVRVHRRRLDREVDVRALELVAAGARAVQPHPLHRRMQGEPPREVQDQLAAGKARGQRQ